MIFIINTTKGEWQLFANRRWLNHFKKEEKPRNDKVHKDCRTGLRGRIRGRLLGTPSQAAPDTFPGAAAPLLYSPVVCAGGWGIKIKNELKSNKIKIRSLPFARAQINCGCKRSRAAARGPLAGSCARSPVFTPAPAMQHNLQSSY